MLCGSQDDGPSQQRAESGVVESLERRGRIIGEIATKMQRRVQGSGKLQHLTHVTGCSSISFKPCK